ncbi:translation initiation factor 2 [uncultured Sphaerochaeta sp.]|uniref:translation initiation factor 2 n=1 Tax=uncultured Sphaerochaeta sp. TaxID=886478 RepID=UPI002A0A2749|nr:translation initiation factor 2 [uncultured Sphaerochaeta sp.]
MITLPYLLQKENICRFEDATFFIGDRRVFPFEKAFVQCFSVEEIAESLKKMVTQGGGPLQVALTTLSYCGHRMEQGTMNANISTFSEAVACLVSARPTNTTMARVLVELLEQITLLFQKNGTIHDIARAIDDLVLEKERYFDNIYHFMGQLGSSLLTNGDTILTTCFAEHTFLLSLAYAKEAGKEVSVLACETRPYLQGARLTAPSLRELGIPVKLITDGMGANLLSRGKVNLYFTAADVVCMDGTVVNKIGTLSNAIACAYYHIPYYAFSISPDRTKLDSSTLQIEERSGREVTHCLGSRITEEGIEALYPSFDIVPHSLVEGLVTPKGILKPSDLSGAYL